MNRGRFLALAGTLVASPIKASAQRAAMESSASFAERCLQFAVSHQDTAGR
jgi:hypothetical protein